MEPWHHHLYHEELPDEESVEHNFGVELSVNVWEYLLLEDYLTQCRRAIEACVKTLEASTVSPHQELSVHHQNHDSFCGDLWLHSLDEVFLSAGHDIWFPGDSTSREFLLCKASSSQKKCSTYELMRSSISGHEHDDDLAAGAGNQQTAPTEIGYHAGLRRLSAFIMPCTIVTLFYMVPTAAAMEHQMQTASPREAAGRGWFNTVVDLSIICAVPAAIIGLLKDLSNEERLPWALGGIMAGLGFGSMFVVGDPRMPDALQISVMILWGVVTIWFIVQKVAKGQMGVWLMLMAATSTLAITIITQDPEGGSIAYLPAAGTISIVTVLKMKTTLVELGAAARRWIHSATRPSDGLV